MKEILGKIKIPFIILAVLFAGFVGYNSLIKKKVDTDKTVVAKKPKSEQPGADLLPLLTKVKNIKLNGNVFNDPVYKSLVDYGQIIVSEPKERPNPFAPLSGAFSASSTVENLGFEDTFIATSTGEQQ